MYDFEFGRCLLDDLLRKRGWTQAMLCEKTGFKKSQVSAYINNKMVMSAQTAYFIAHVVGCHVEELYQYKVTESM